MMTPKQALGKRLRERREYMKLTQQEVANALSINRVSYTQYESGKNGIAATDIPILAKILKVPVSYFFDDDPDYARDGSAINSYYNGLSPEQQSLIFTMVKAAYEQSKREETTHGRKAEIGDSQQENELPNE